jgi:hypothetical protein
MRTVLLALLATFMLDARAVTFSTDFSDLWSNPNEQGWGVNVVQQREVVFATVFVYDQARAPTWYVGSGLVYEPRPGSSIVFTGPLYQTTGPWFGGAFNPALFTPREVGTITIEFFSITQALITYVVDGLTIAKSMGRQTWRMNDLGGEYRGFAMGTYSGTLCPAAGSAEEPVTLNVSHSPENITMTVTYPGRTCTYSGVYQQSGRMGTMTGAASCTNGASGTILLAEMEANIVALTARGQVRFGTSCLWVGRIGAMFRDPQKVKDSGD